MDGRAQHGALLARHRLRVVARHVERVLLGALARGVHLRVNHVELRLVHSVKDLMKELHVVGADALDDDHLWGAGGAGG